MYNLTFRVAGVAFGDRQRIIKQLDRDLADDTVSGELVTLTPEPNNPHDANAIAVMHGADHLGYVPRDRTDAVRDLLDRGAIAHIKEITGGTDAYPTFGVIVYVGVPMSKVASFAEADYQISEQAFDDVIREDIFDDFDPWGHSEGHDLIDTFGDRQ